MPSEYHELVAVKGFSTAQKTRNPTPWRRVIGTKYSCLHVEAHCFAHFFVSIIEGWWQPKRLTEAVYDGQVPATGLTADATYGLAHREIPICRHVLNMRIMTVEGYVISRLITQ